MHLPSTASNSAVLAAVAAGRLPCAESRRLLARADALHVRASVAVAVLTGIGFALFFSFYVTWGIHDAPSLPVAAFLVAFPGVIARLLPFAAQRFVLRKWFARAQGFDAVSFIVALTAVDLLVAVPIAFALLPAFESAMSIFAPLPFVFVLVPQGLLVAVVLARHLQPVQPTASSAGEES